MCVRGRRGSRVPCEAHGFKGLRCRRFSKLSKVLGRQVTKVEGVQVNYEVSRSPSSLTTPNSLTTPIDIKIEGFRAGIRYQGLPVA